MFSVGKSLSTSCCCVKEEDPELKIMQVIVITLSGKKV
jgi:hypothetical protein